MFSVERDPERLEIPSVNSRSGAFAVITPLIHWLRDLLSASRATLAKKQKLTTISASKHEVQAFLHLVNQAKEIYKIDPTGLTSLVTAILRPLQSEQILSVAEREQHAAVAEIVIWRLFSQDSFFSMFEERDCLRRDSDSYRVKFSRDVVLTTPWRRDRFAEALALIGTDKKLGTWKRDYNHQIALILPWHFGIVTSGNHSITAGILNGQGEVTPTEVHDLTPLLSRVYCDGQHFIDASTQTKLAVVSNHRLAALYEIGRIMAGCDNLTGGDTATSVGN